MQKTEFRGEYVKAPLPPQRCMTVVAYSNPIALGVFKIPFCLWFLLKQTFSLSTFCLVIPETMKHVRVSFSHCHLGVFFMRVSLAG